MIRPETAAQSAFRNEVRDWLEGALPEDLRGLTFRPAPDRIRNWYRAVSDRGWIAPHWPKAVGGMGADPVEEVILLEEFARVETPDLPGQGLYHVGPILIGRGTQQQKEVHLPGILSGDVIWCQGYSEPGAGSDLAALRTTARRDGDYLVVDGSKIWTTWGHHADWMFALVRTGGARAEGITFLLIDMTTPGITTRPITTIAGDEEFCEVFFDQVRVPIDNVVGTIGEGWDIATSVLEGERINIGGPAQILRAFARLKSVLASVCGDTATAAARLEHAAMLVETVIAAFLEAKELRAAGRGPEGRTAYLKLLSTEATLELHAMIAEASGPWSGVAVASRSGTPVAASSDLVLQGRRMPIYGGSSEVLRSIVSRRVLEL